MENITKDKLKKAIARNDVNTVIKNLFEVFSMYREIYGDEYIADYYDQLILLSNKLNELKKNIDIGIIDNYSESLNRSKLNYSLLNFINVLPNEILIQKELQSPISIKESDTRIKSGKANTQDEFEFDAFISFANKDSEIAKKLWRELKNYGLKIFLSNESLKNNAGHSFFEKIQYALSNSRQFILVCTSNSMKSEWVKTEYETFYNEFYINHKQLRNIMLFHQQNFNIKQLPLFLRRLQVANTARQVAEVLLQYEDNTKESFREKIRNKELFENELEALLRFFISEKEFYIPPSIPKYFNGESEEFYKAVFQICRIPDTEQILALVILKDYDGPFNPFCSIVFGKKGLYYNNSFRNWYVKQKGVHSIKYEELKNRKIREGNFFRHPGLISLDNGFYLDVAGSSFGNKNYMKLLNLTKELVIKYL